jgi:hypothetical protein
MHQVTGRPYHHPKKSPTKSSLVLIEDSNDFLMHIGFV